MDTKPPSPTSAILKFMSKAVFLRVRFLATVPWSSQIQYIVYLWPLVVSDSGPKTLCCFCQMELWFLTGTPDGRMSFVHGSCPVWSCGFKRSVKRDSHCWSVKAVTEFSEQFRSISLFGMGEKHYWPHKQFFCSWVECSLSFVLFHRLSWFCLFVAAPGYIQSSCWMFLGLWVEFKMN